MRDSRPSHICGVNRVAGEPIIAPRRNRSAHLHRPWRATVRFFTISLPRVRKHRIKPSTAHVKLCCVRGPQVLLIREPQDKRQGSTEPGHVLVVETPDFLSDPFASDGDRLIGHHLRCEPQSIFGLGINRDAKIRSFRQFGSQLADHHRSVAVGKGVSCTMTAGRGLP